MRGKNAVSINHNWMMAAVAAAIVITVQAIAAPVHAQNFMQPYKLVDGHTAGVLPKGHFDLEFKFAAAGNPVYGSGILTGMHIGLSNRLTLGLLYGGEGLIGRGDRVRWHPFPGIFAKYRLFEEHYATPALAIGFDNQGYGGLTHGMPFGYDGYIYKSPGFFVALSKNYIMFSIIQIGFHGVVNYSLEEAGTVRWPNVLTGIDLGINEELALVVEYDLAINDVTGVKSGSDHVRPHLGFMNLGLRWAFAPNFHVELQFKDIMENKVTRASEMGPLIVENVPIGWNREIKIVYYASF